MSNLTKRIAEELGDTPDEEVLELVVDECECTQLTELTNKYVNLEKLSAAGCGVETLKGFPSFPNLKRLDLSSNNLPDGELGYLKGCTSLTYLLLCGNPIKDLNSLLPLKEHKSLEKLDLTGCEFEDDYRDKVFEMLKQLIVLDGADRDGTEVADESDEDGADDEDDVDRSEDDDEEGVPDDFDEEEEEDGEADGDDDDHERGVKRKHEDEEGDEDA